MWKSVEFSGLICGGFVCVCVCVYEAEGRVDGVGFRREVRGMCYSHVFWR